MSTAARTPPAHRRVRTAAFRALETLAVIVALLVTGALAAPVLWYP